MPGPMRVILPALLAVAALLAGCAVPTTRVVLLPQADGKPSAVVVQAKSGARTLDEPYERATAKEGARGAPALDTVDPAALHAEHPELFALAPPPAQRFILYFQPGTTTLTPESQALLERALGAATARSGGDIVITGHTDRVGARESNDALSRRRAQLLRDLLINRGFPADRIEAVGRGEREPAVPTADEVDEPRNRRVVIDVR